MVSSGVILRLKYLIMFKVFMFKECLVVIMMIYMDRMLIIDSMYMGIKFELLICDKIKKEF